VIKKLKPNNYSLFLAILLSYMTFSFAETQLDKSELAIRSQNNQVIFKLNRLILADTEVKVKALKFPNNNGKILIMDIPALNTKDFADLITPSLGLPITSETISAVTKKIHSYLDSRGFKEIHILVPDQNVSTGELRIAVITGKFTLAHLCLSSIAKINTPLSFDPNRGQIIIDDLPPYISTQAFALIAARYFSKPITSDLINEFVVDLSAYVTRQGGYLAAIQIPQQNVESGTLRIGLQIGLYKLRKLVIAGTDEEAKSAKVPTSTNFTYVFNNPLYSTKDFEHYIHKYLNKPITVNLVFELKQDLIAYGKAHDRYMVDTTNPYIDLNTGEIRIGVVIARYNKLHLKGNRWFSDQLLENKLGIKPGDEIKVSELDNAISWANQNPFRQVQVAIDQINKPIGTADLDIAVNESLPVRLSASYSNAINSPIGNSAYTASAQVGNLWGLDHEMTFQYSTNNTPKYDQSYSFSYKAPLFWHDFIRTDIAYSLVYPQALFGYIGLNEKAKNTIVDVRYIKPITRGRWSFDQSFGLDYKQISTNMLFGSLTNPVAVYDVAQLVAGFTAVHRDLKGSWTLGLNADFSPGGLNNRDTELAYSRSGVTGKSVRYLYGKIIAERDTNLPLQTVWVSRAQLQVASTNLQGSEQLLLGGGATVRGYAQSYSGDQGWILNQELRTKYFKTHIPFTNKNKTQLYTQFVSFLDYGDVSYKHVKPSDVALPRLMGTGVGIRSSIYGNFSMGSDMSWPIIKPTYLDTHPAKGTFWATLAY